MWAASERRPRPCICRGRRRKESGHLLFNVPRVANALRTVSLYRLDIRYDPSARGAPSITVPDEQRSDRTVLIILAAALQLASQLRTQALGLAREPKEARGLCDHKGLVRLWVRLPGRVRARARAQARARGSGSGSGYRYRYRVRVMRAAPLRS